MGHSRVISAVLLVSVLNASDAFAPSQNRQTRRNQFDRHLDDGEGTVLLFESAAPASFVGMENAGNMEKNSGANTNSSLVQELSVLCADDQFEDAIDLLKEESSKETHAGTNEGYHEVVLMALVRSRRTDGPELADGILTSLLDQGIYPSTSFYNSVIAIWSESLRKEAGKKCFDYLESIWSHFNETSSEIHVPMRSSYISCITALARSRQGREGAEKAEQLLEEMEAHRLQHPQLTPNTICVNAVLNAWSKSNLWRGSATRCEQILDRMIKMYPERPEMKPDTRSFNAAIDTLAKSSEYDCERRAETLLERMEELCANDPTLDCRPDQVSFNTVLNCWAQSRIKGAARRATAILKHMEERFAAYSTDIHPDTASYTTVINAWARSRESDAVVQAEEIMRWSEAAFNDGNPDVRPNALTYNSMINCYAKSREPDASVKALALLNEMKDRCGIDGIVDCKPDVVTYTTVIDTLAKERTYEAAKQAELLLDELESAYRESSGDRRLRPNVRTYTSVINAIGRSGKNPERAEAILDRIESLAKDGDYEVRPDVVSFNAVINAYGWSREKGKSKKCFEILQRMLALFESGELVDAKPDIITCNSVLNACAFENTDNESQRAEIMDIVVETLETFQKKAPKFGYPDHATYSQVLSAISKHMPRGDQRYEMAEATFWQCSNGGHVSALVIGILEKTLPWDRFAKVMGPSLKSRQGEKVRYDLHRFPKEWTRFAPEKKQGSRSSQKRDRGFQITKSTLAKTKKSPTIQGN